VPEIGDELTVARAMSELAHRLLDSAAADIEGITHRPVHLDTGQRNRDF
jgi:Rv2632c-like